MAEKSDKVVLHKQKRRPSLRYLAEKTGISHTAIARVLRDNTGLDENTREYIRRVAREEGYVFSDVPQSLITGWHGTIGVILPRLTGPFTSKIAAGIVEALWQYDMMPVMLSSELDPTREEKMLEALAKKRVGGLILMPCRVDRDKDHFVHLVKQHTPIISLDDHMPKVNVPMVASDDGLGGEMATKHLIEAGHKHILHIGPSVEGGHTNEPREAAYRRVMREAGLKSTVIHLPRLQMKMQDVLPTLEQWFDSKEGRKTTAVFAFNDPAALYMYELARRRNLSIGKDLALIGYGNSRGMSGSALDAIDFIQPTLSSVDQHPETWGQIAVELLREMVAGKPVSQQTLIKPELILRDSSA